MDGRSKNVRIFDTRATYIVAEIFKIINTKSVPVKCYCLTIGKLRHVKIIFPGTKGLFSTINKELKGDPFVIGLGKISEV